MRSRKIRKTITLSKEAEKLLKELSQHYGLSQSELIEKLILERSKTLVVRKRLEALKGLVNVAKEA